MYQTPSSFQSCFKGCNTLASLETALEKAFDSSISAVSGQLTGMTLVLGMF
jgi:hypothetical protein